MSSRTAGLLCLLVGAIWGMGFIATSQALEAFGPYQVLAIRFSGAAVIAWIPLLAHRIRPGKSALGKGLVCGVFLFLAFLFQTLGLEATEAGSNAFFTAANVVMVPFLAWAVARKRPSILQFAACGLCFAGIGLMGYTPEGISPRPGDLLSLTCAFFFACHIVALSLAKDEDAGIINAIQMTMAAALSLIPGLKEPWSASVSAGSLFSVFYLIAGSTWLAFWLQTRAQEHIDASRASLLLATESLWANVFAVLILHEHPSGFMIAGGLMILTAVCLAELPGGPEKDRHQKRSGPSDSRKPPV